MSKLQEIQAQIAKLKKEAEDVRKTETAAAVATVRKLIAEFGLTIKQIGISKNGTIGSLKASALSPIRTVGVPKYRDPKSGKTWTGKGTPPKWIAGARNRDRFLIDKPPVDESAASPSPAAKPTPAAKPAKKTAAAAPKKSAAPADKPAEKSVSKTDQKAAKGVKAAKPAEAPAKKAGAKAAPKVATKSVAKASPAAKKPAKAAKTAAEGKTAVESAGSSEAAGTTPASGDGDKA